jgi:hypothetical protein
MHSAFPLRVDLRPLTAKTRVATLGHDNGIEFQKPAANRRAGLSRLPGSQTARGCGDTCAQQSPDEAQVYSAERDDAVRTTAKAIVILVLLVLVPNTSRPASVDRLYCNNRFTAYIDASPAIIITKATLKSDYFRIWAEAMVSRDVLKRIPSMTLDPPNWAVGYQLDGSIVTGIQPLVHATHVTMILSFPHLANGNHRLRLGFINTLGQLDNDQSYCFSTPGSFTFTE